MSWIPRKKVSAGAVAATATAILTWVVASYFGLELPNEVQDALIVLIGFGASYLKSEE